MKMYSGTQPYLGLGFLCLKRRLGNYFTCVADITVIFDFIDSGKSSLQKINISDGDRCECHSNIPRRGNRRAAADTSLLCRK